MGQRDEVIDALVIARTEHYGDARDEQSPAWGSAHPLIRAQFIVAQGRRAQLEAMTDDNLAAEIEEELRFDQKLKTGRRMAAEAETAERQGIIREHQRETGRRGGKKRQRDSEIVAAVRELRRQHPDLSVAKAAWAQLESRFGNRISLSTFRQSYWSRDK